MNVLIATNYPIPHGGGLSTHLMDLMRCLQEDGHSAFLLERKAARPSRLSSAARRLLWGIRSERFRSWWTDSSVTQLADRIRRHLLSDKVDLIHCHDPLAGCAALTALKAAGRRVPVVETVHGPLTYETQMMMGVAIDQSRHLQHLWEMEKLAYLSATRLIAVDTGQARIAIDDFGADEKKVAVIFNAVACSLIDEVVRQASTLNTPQPYVLVPRRLVHKTGVHVAIEAFGRANGDRNLHMVIVGDGPMQGELRRLASDCGLDGRVHFMGSVPRDEVLRLMKPALAVLVPSIPSSGVVEATSIAALEAMACGTVIIASDLGGLAQIIEHQRTGLLVPAGDSKALGEAIRLVVSSADLRQSIGEQARRHVLTSLDCPIWYRKIVQVYAGARQVES